MPRHDPRLRELFRSDVGSIESNDSIFELLLGYVTATPVQSRDCAAFWAQTASYFAWMNHPGVHSSLRLERALGTLPPRDSDARRRLDRPRPRVVHVLTQALSTGGHTRLAWRWINADLAREASVVLTGQGWQPVPPQLAEAVSRSGGTLTDLGSKVGLLPSRAIRLRNLIANADLVVLHIHPFDVVPQLALAGWAARPPVLLMNHADHVFWFGVSISDVVVHFRASGASLSVMRRGIEDRRVKILPIPVDEPAPDPDRLVARAFLGIEPRDVVALSVAQSYKFEPREGVDYIEAMMDALERAPNLRVLVVGPTASGRWAEAEAMSGGRIRALGIRSDIQALYRAADVFVDSMPIGSLTSLLEAGTNALPLVTRAGADGFEILGMDSPGLDQVAIACETTEDVAKAVAGLATSTASRVDLGRRTREAILLVASGAGWLGALEDAYSAAVSLHRETREPKVIAVAGRFDPVDRRLARLHAPDSGLKNALRAQLRYAPLREQAAIAGESIRAGEPPALGSFAPDWLRCRARRLVDRRKGVR